MYLTQYTMSVNEYIAKFDRLSSICDLNENERIARFIKGLNRRIANKVEMSSYNSFKDVCKLALKIESHWNDECFVYNQGFIYNELFSSD